MAVRQEVKDTKYPGIKQRLKDGKYIVTLDLGREFRLDKKTGEMKNKQVKTTKIVSSLKEARSLQSQNETRKKITGQIKAQKYLFKDVYFNYIQEANKDSSEGYRNNRAAQGRRILAYFGNLYIEDIDTLTIEKFFDWCRTDNSRFKALSNSTLINIKSLLRDIWKYAKKNKAYNVPENVVIDAEIGKVQKSEHSVLDVAELNYMLNYSLTEKDKSNMVLVLLAGFCGLRRGEILGLTWDKIDPESHTMLINTQRCQIGSSFIYKEPKNEKERLAPVSNKVLELLQSLPQKEFIYYRDGNEEPRPEKVSRYFSQFQKRMNKKRKAEGLEEIQEIRLHDLRHTFISICLNSNMINPLQVSSAVGHNVRGSTTLEVYWHDQGNREQIVDYIDSIIDIT